MVTFYDSEVQARADATALGLREKVLCFVVPGNQLLVFDHADHPEAGVQVPAGGVEAGEVPAQAAVRELFEESGLTLNEPVCLTSYRWEAQLPERPTRQVCHAFAFHAPLITPDAWIYHADGYLFSFRWADLSAPGLDWEMDAALPALHHMFPIQETAHD